MTKGIKAGNSAIAVVVEKNKLYFWCSCGKSLKQPFCDGSHKGSSFTPQKVVIEETRNIAFCNCKHSANGAFCDGSHSSLS